MSVLAFYCTLVIQGAGICLSGNQLNWEDFTFGFSDNTCQALLTAFFWGTKAVSPAECEQWLRYYIYLMFFFFCKSSSHHNFGEKNPSVFIVLSSGAPTQFPLVWMLYSSVVLSQNTSDGCFSQDHRLS